MVSSHFNAIINEYSIIDGSFLIIYFNTFAEFFRLAVSARGLGNDIRFS